MGDTFRSPSVPKEVPRMPWEELSSMDQKAQFSPNTFATALVRRVVSPLWCVSRKTGYKWIARYQELGAAGLEDRSRRPHASPSHTPRRSARRSSRPDVATQPGVPRSCLRCSNVPTRLPRGRRDGPSVTSWRARGSCVSVSGSPATRASRRPSRRRRTNSGVSTSKGTSRRPMGATAIR